jgi:hypothetical protein
MSTNKVDKKKRVQENAEVTKNVGDAKQKYVEQRKEDVSVEGVEAINMIVGVIETLKEKNKEEALKKIEEVLGKLEVLVAKDPSRALVPVDVQEQIVDFPGTVDDAIKIREAAKLLLEKDQVHQARELLLPLASEIVMYITALPLVTYPEAVKAVVPLIEEEKYEEAIILLSEVLQTLVIEKVVLPLPILRAEHTINLAQELTKEDENANKEELKKLLEYAEEQLLLAQVLGYGNIEKDYADINKEIEAIKAKLEDENSNTKGIFETLKEKLNALMADQNKVKKEEKAS